MTKNQILLKRLLVNLPDAGQDNLAETMSIQRELMTWGFMLSEDAFNMVKKADLADAKDFYTDIVSYIKSVVGSDGFKELYGNFPMDKMVLGDANAWYLQIAHYWGFKNFNVVSPVKDTAFEQVSYKVIEPCTDNEFKQIFYDLLTVGNSLTKFDQETIEWIANNVSGLKYPDTIPFKENLAIIARICPDFTVKTVIDVLRVAVGFSGGDVSLPAVPKLMKKNPKGKPAIQRAKDRQAFRFKLTPEECERILHLFENSNLSLQDMNMGRKYARFIKLAEFIHPEKNGDMFPKTARAFYLLRNQKRKGKPDGEAKIRTWYSYLEAAKKKSYADYLFKLMERPGEFLRRLDYLIRTYPKNLQDTLKALSTISQGSSNKVILETMEHFGNRNKSIPRSVFIKGARQRTQLPTLQALSPSTIQAVRDTLWTVLVNKFVELPALGKCWIDEELKKIPMPLNMRSLSESLVVTVRGQRTPLNMPTAKVIRPYVQWIDDYGTQDLDLSVTFVGDNSPQVLSFRQQSLGNFALHSGDVRHRKGKCAEYADITVETAVQRGYKYAVIDVRDFNNSSNGLSDKKAVFGFMERENPECNSTWLPSTVTNAIKLSSKSTATIACIIDLETREYIWIDEDSSKNTAHNPSEILEMIKRYYELPEFSIYHLIELHVNARGVLSTKDEADTHFLYEDFSKDYLPAMKLLGV